MRKEIANSGSMGEGIIDPANDNFKEVYQNPASKIQRFISKVRSYSVYKSDVIRVSVWADSIWNTYLPIFENFLEATFPDKTFEYVHAQLGGTGANYHAAMVWEVINFNPDLIIIEEFEDWRNQEFAETLIKLIKQKTSADILLNPFPIKGQAMDYLVDNDLVRYKREYSYQYRQWFYAIASKYDCGVLDWDLQVIRDLWNGDVTTAELTTDNTHRLPYFYDTYVPVTMASFFQELYSNEYLNNSGVDWFKTIKPSNDLYMPDISEGIVNGNWIANNIAPSSYPIDKTYDTLKSSEIGAYYEVGFNGIGVEISHFGQDVGQYGLLMDGAAPSTLLKDYVTSAHNVLIGLYKIIVDSNILSNDETSRYFRVIMETSTTYTLRDLTNAVDIRTGCSIAQDEVFAVTGGQLTIPANYAGVTNWRGDLLERTPYEFYIKKNWYDTVDIAADDLTTVTRIFGLNRGEHTIRIVNNSGVVNIDSIMELK